MESPLALYRRYRPETFDEVIGQDHVTEPLTCGYRGRPGEPRLPLLRHPRHRQDARPRASWPSPQLRAGAGRRPVRRVRVVPGDRAPRRGHRRDRDRRRQQHRRRQRPRHDSNARTAPAAAASRSTSSTRSTCSRSRAFNALLKTLEEPPAHVKFILATTEPEKVLPTIRSRTHHYPFRLIPPRLLSSYLFERSARRSSSRSSRPRCRWSSGRGRGPRVTLCQCSTS